MASPRTGEDNSKTREAILDATEKIMREEGYAAVTSRRVAAVAGLKSQLVHYHFGTMDDLFLALYERWDSKSFEHHMQAVSSSKPLRALWELSFDRVGMDLTVEFVALANHRKVIQKAIRRGNKRTRSMQAAMLARALEEQGIPPDVCPPNVLSLIIAGTTRALLSERSIGASAAHADTLAFVERLLQKFEKGDFALKPAGRGPRC